MLKELKEFLMRGNVIDLAVAVVIATAFGKIVDSLVEHIIMPSIALLFGDTDFTSDWVWNGITYGQFIQSIIDFLIIGTSVFIFIKVFNRLTGGRFEEKVEEIEEEEDEQTVLLREIRDSLRRS